MATLPCWKSIYSVLYYSYNVEAVNVSYDINSVANLGIAFSWREHIYYNYKPLTFIGKVAKSAIYSILTVFTKDSIHYKYSEDV